MIEGLITLHSSRSAKETAERLAQSVVNHGMTIVARVDHAAAAAKVGLDLRQTELLIFGNPAAGTLLMQSIQQIGLDLPLKALVWQDEAAVVSVSYPDLHWLAKRYGVSPTVGPAVDKMAYLLEAVMREATA